MPERRPANAPSLLERLMLLFAYGTLQQEAVQIATFGRRLEGAADILSGFQLTALAIEDSAVIAISGSNRHTMATYSGRAEDVVTGTVFVITPDELARADQYEVSAVTRIEVELGSGARAWVYVDARSAIGLPRGEAP